MSPFDTTGRAFGPLLAVVLASFGLAGQDSSPSSPAFMPQVPDYVLSWWAEGFPGHVPSAPWRRVIRTGSYAFVLDTDSLRVPHFGTLAGGSEVDYLAATRDRRPVWSDLPPADLQLTVAANGRAYRCTAGGRWTTFTGPRVIESGRFLQRADVTDLLFTDADGVRLEAEARFETVAWPDRLALILAVRPREPWNEAVLEITLGTTKGTQGPKAVQGRRWELPPHDTWPASEWHEVVLALDLAADNSVETSSPVIVRAAALPEEIARPVTYDPARGWHAVNLDGLEPIVPPGGGPERQNDAIERVKLVLENPTDREQVARLLFEQHGDGIRQRLGSPITGVSAVLRFPDGQPTGIPVQLSKNWHTRPEGGVYAGTWFHGFTQVRLPPRARTEFELALVHGHLGGVAAASHAQLCLVGWGSNQQWDQSALGAWGESICYEPDQVQAQASILDVRPLMVRSMSADQPWQWTHNVGGGDFVRLFDPLGRRVPHAAMRTAYLRQGPCLTEVTYAGRVGQALEHAATVSLARTDDLVRGTYRLRLDVTEIVEFSRLVIFQIGADTYSYTGERKMALGNESGLTREWATQWGEGLYRTEPMECTGRVPWVSLHEAVSRAESEARARGQAGAPGAWANRGVIIRAWQARLGGRPARPWVRERGVRVGAADTSTLDVVPPPEVTRLAPGDFVEATFEHIVMPQFAGDYYGPNAALRAALRERQNTWCLIHREAVGNDRRVEVEAGVLEALYPAVTMRAADDLAAFKLAGGLGYVPVTFNGLSRSHDYVLLCDGQPVDQSVHGRDYWQTDYDPVRRCWSRTYNVPVEASATHRLELRQQP